MPDAWRYDSGCDDNPGAGLNEERIRRTGPGDAPNEEGRFAFGAALVELVGNLAIDLGLLRVQDEVFHFPLDLPDAQAVGQGGEDFVRFAQQVGGHGAV